MLELRVISVPDGRDLAWCEIGSTEGAPVFVFHGSPGSGREFVKYEPVLADYRVVAPDRPGYGHSTYHPRRTFASWADDVRRLADHLGLDRFGVMGVSSGGPNAAACARFLGDRLTGCAIVSGPAPPVPSVSDEGMLAANRIGRRLLRLAPRITPRLLSPLVEAALRAAHRSPERAVRYVSRTLAPPDVAVVSRPEVRTALFADLERPLPSTAGRAAVQDFALEVNDWGFRLEDIAIPVHVWHGRQDRTVPMINGTRQADAIPAATLHTVDDAGHSLIYDHLGDILALVSA